MTLIKTYDKKWFFPTKDVVFSAKNSPNQIYLTDSRRFIKISSQKANRVNDHPEIQNNVLKRRRVIEFDSLQTHEKKRQYDFYGKKKLREVIEIRFGFVDGRKLFNQHAVRHTS